MALIGTLRNKGGKILVALLALVMIAFIGGEFFAQLGPGGGNQSPEIAVMNGKDITNAEFQQKVDELSYTFAINTGRNPLQQETEQIREQAWNAMILNTIYSDQFEELGIEVTNKELVDLVQGANISPQIKQFFGNPETGQFEKENVTNFLASLQDAQPQQRNAWIAFEQSLVPNREIEKYLALLDKTSYSSKYETKSYYESQNANANISYLYVPFLTVPDSVVTFTESELETYLTKNAKEFQRPESRDLEYVSFKIEPSSLDSSIVADEVAGLKRDLFDSENDSSFAIINSDDALAFLTYTDDNLPTELVDQEVGFVSEPAIVNGAYEFYKLSRKEVITSDSTRYRVAKIKKEFFVSDETINDVYREADLFAASAGNLEEFRRLAKEQELSIIPATRITKNAQRVGVIPDGRTLVVWLYRDAEKGSVSEVKEVDGQYVVAAMTNLQEEGTANLKDVRNQVEQKVKNQKKAEFVLQKFEGVEADLEALKVAYGEGAKEGTADITLSTSSISGVGFAPEAVGIAFVLEEGETTNPFATQDGVMALRLEGKEIPDELDTYREFSAQIANQRRSPNSVIADFPLSYFRIMVPRNVDESLKEAAEIEDLRYKFF
ncbi:MAG: SurA N-terminal domain-containing protein [Bacteroidota bacterium]